MIAFKNPVYKTTVTIKKHTKEPVSYNKSISEKAVYQQGQRVEDVIEYLKSQYGRDLISIDSVEFVEFIRVVAWKNPNYQLP